MVVGHSAPTAAARDGLIRKAAATRRGKGGREGIFWQTSSTTRASMFADEEDVDLEVCHDLPRVARGSPSRWLVRHRAVEPGRSRGCWQNVAAR
jgi:hypothetical protein